MTTPNVLLIEDNPITRKLVRFALEREGIEVREAADGATALRSIDSRTPDLILQDLLLPDIDGFELVRQLRQIASLRDVPILAFSGFLSQLDEKRIGAVGFTDLISKPIEPSHLLRIVRAYLLPGRGAVTRVIGHGRRLVLADDDPVQRKLTAFRLGQLGFDVTAAGDGVEAFDAAKRLTPSAVVSDIMMPKMDGFGLAAAIRQDEQLRNTRIVLMTSTYLDGSDRELGRKAGADAFVVRTPNMREMAQALEAVLRGLPTERSPMVPVSDDFERARFARAMAQLERQVALSASASQQRAVLSAELAVLNAISEAIINQQDIETILRETLAACFDAGGVSVGVLYLVGESGKIRTYRVGTYTDWTDEQVDTFFGEPALLRRLIAQRSITTMASPADGEQGRFLERSGLKSALVVPLANQQDDSGALVMFSKRLDFSLDDRVLFAQALGNQISVALSLARSFEQRAASERSARHHAALLTSVFASISDAILVAEQGRLSMWNAAAQSLFGLDEDDRQSYPLAELAVRLGLYETDKVTLAESSQLPMLRASSGTPVDRAELFLRNTRRPEGGWLTISAEPLYHEDGKVRGSVSICRDVTQEKLAQEQRVVSDRMASVGMLAASIGHEINNPLACVIANLEMAAGDLATLSQRHENIDVGELPDELREAGEGAQRVAQIVRDLKMFSRGEDERRGPVDVEDVLESSIRMAWNEIRHRARVVRNFGRVPSVEGSAARLGQVFLNLIVNAAQAIPAGQADRNQIRISTRLDGATRVMVDIDDTGPGIPPEVMSRIFTPFVTTKAIGVGTGLGLAICHRLVTGMGGEISADTTPGVGTVFHVSLRTAEKGAERSVPIPRTEGHSASPRGRILVVDDEPAIGMIVGRALRGIHEVSTTTNALDAVTSIADGARYDVILSDLMMPVMTGMDFYYQVRRIAPDQASVIVFLTGGAFTAQMRSFLDGVGNRCLEKPFDVSTLKGLVADQVRSRSVR